MKRFAIILTVAIMLAVNILPTFAVTGSWTMAGGTPDRRHYSSAGLTPPFKFAWDTNKEGSIYAVPPLISGNFCYLGMAKVPVDNVWQLSVQKRNIEDGNIVWDLEGGWWIWCIYGSDLIVQGYSPKTGSWLKRINAMDKSTVWEIEWPRTTIHSVIEDDVIYSFSYSDWKEDEKQKEITERIYFFQANSAENGRMLWRKKYSYDKAYFAPWFCIWGDGLYGGIAKDFYRLDKSTGAQSWKISLPENIAQGSYIVGTEKGVLCNTIYDNLRLIKHEDGSIIWTKKLSEYIPDDENCGMPSGTPAIMSGKAYIVSRGFFKSQEPKKLICLDLATGRSSWEIALTNTSTIEHSDIGYTCTATSGAIITMTEDMYGRQTKLRAFDPSSGVLIWSDVAPGLPNPSELAVDSEYMIMGLESKDDHGKGVYSYYCFTSKGAPKPKLEVDQSEFDLGYTNSKEPINKIIKIKNSGSGELQGSITADVPWIVCNPSQFQGNNQNVVLSIKPESLQLGSNKGVVTISSSGGKKTVTITVSYGGGATPKSTKESITVKCGDVAKWSKTVELKGFHHGIVSVSAPWILASPLAFEDNDPSILITLNPSALHNTSVFTGKVTITTNLEIRTIDITVTGVTQPVSIIMQVSSKNATINGMPNIIDPAPMIIKGSTFVPLRFVGDAFGVKLGYDAKTKIITYTTTAGLKVTLQIDSSKATVGDKQVVVNPPPTIYKGKTLVPIRFISDSFGAQITYNAPTKMIRIDLAACP